MSGLAYGLPEEAGFDSEGLEKVCAVVDQSVNEKAFPAAVLLVAQGGIVATYRAFGRLSYDLDSPPTQKDTIFDLASLTKVVATTTASMILYEADLLDLDERASHYIPDFAKTGKENITVRHLLTHSSGLPSWLELYKTCKGKEAFLSAICETDLIYEIGTEAVYSDLGIIVLGAIIERLAGDALDRFCQRKLFDPLCMKDTLFNPPEDMWYRIAPTEDVPSRGGVVVGQVHDENAWAMGGVAPHAGLFSTAWDLALFCQMLLNGGQLNDQRIVGESNINLFSKRQEIPKGSSRALGWDTKSEEHTSIKLFSNNAFGHTGFTGTSMWIDPDRKLFVILLTNRVHPTRENLKISEVRAKVHDRVIEAVISDE